MESPDCGSHSAVLGFPSRRPISVMANSLLDWAWASSRKYDIGLGLFGDGVATRNTLITTTGLHEGAQQPSSENGFGSWVWTFECPPDLAIGLHLYLWFITFKLSNYPFVTMQFEFAFNQLVIFNLIAEFAHYNHVHAILVLAHENKLQPYMPNKRERD